MASTCNEEGIPLRSATHAKEPNIRRFNGVKGAIESGKNLRTIPLSHISITCHLKCNVLLLVKCAG